MKMSPDILQMLPAGTLFYSSFELPRVKSMTPENVKAVIARETQASDQISATFFYLGDHRDQTASFSKVGVLIPQGKDKLSILELTALFQNYYTHEVFVREVCDAKGIVISPVKDVLSEIDDGCSKKQPNLSNASSEIAKAMSGPEAAHTVMINMGRLLNAALSLGIQLDSASDKLNSEEVLEAQKILGKMPALFLSGKIESAKWQ